MTFHAGGLRRKLSNSRIGERQTVLRESKM